MYDELVKRLREHNGWALNETLDKAADAIEELSNIREEQKAQIILMAAEIEEQKPRWIPVTERFPSDFVSVQAHMTDAGNFPPVREAYVVNKNWFFPALKEFHPVDMWKRFDEPPKEE